MSALIQLREAARALYRLREDYGWDALQEAADEFTDDELAKLLSCWQFAAREKQLRPAGADMWLIMAGRGFGKTHAGANDTLDIAEEWGPEYRGLLTSKAYTRDIQNTMVRDGSGLMPQARLRGYELAYVQSESRLYHPAGGHWTLISADNPEAFRGGNFNHVWADEIAKWHDPVYVWRNIVLANRLDTQPGPVRFTITTTPKRASPIILSLVQDDDVVITGGSSEENNDNISAAAVAKMRQNMGKTAFGRSEMDGEFIVDVGAMTSQGVIDKYRVVRPPAMARRVVSFDPAASDGDDADDHGIIAVGTDFENPQRAYVLADRTLAQGRPEEASEIVVRLALEWRAESIVYERNQGGLWVESMLRVAMDKIAIELDRPVKIDIVGVWAKAAKEVRAEPVGGLYDNGRVSHVGHFEEYEEEATTWIPGMPSPNRVDAAVHGITHLLLGDGDPDIMTPYHRG